MLSKTVLAMTTSGEVVLSSADSPGQFYLGTAGYTYPHWRRCFYPPGELVSIEMRC
jgi:hypothetical protein